MTQPLLEQRRWCFWLRLLLGAVMAHFILVAADVPEGFDRNWAQWIVSIAVIVSCMQVVGWVIWALVLWIRPGWATDSTRAEGSDV